MLKRIVMLLLLLREQVSKLSPARKYFYLGIVLLVGVYCLWLKFGAKPIKPGEAVTAQTAKPVAGMDRKAVTPKKLMVLTPKKEAVERLGLPAEQSLIEDEEIIDSVDIPATRYGTTSTVFVNLSTGRSRTIVKAKESPWFSFLRDNTIGAEFGIGKGGQYYSVDYKRDLIQIKGVVLGVRGEVKQQSLDNNIQIGLRAEYKW